MPFCFSLFNLHFNFSHVFFSSFSFQFFSWNHMPSDRSEHFEGWVRLEPSRKKLDYFRPKYPAHDRPTR
jgi:hypothetical protein